MSVCVVYIYYSIRLCLIILPIRGLLDGEYKKFRRGDPPGADAARGCRVPRLARLRLRAAARFSFTLRP